MQVCCQSRRTTSSPPNLTAPTTPTVFSTYPHLLYTVDSTAYLPGHTHPSLVPLPSHWDYQSPVATQSSLLVDTGYVSAEASPTSTAAVHSLMVSRVAMAVLLRCMLDYSVMGFIVVAVYTLQDCPKVELLNPSHYSPVLHSSYWFMLQQAGYFVNHSRL